jgi:hypothetical protein
LSTDTPLETAKAECMAASVESSDYGPDDDETAHDGERDDEGLGRSKAARHVESIVGQGLCFGVEVIGVVGGSDDVSSDSWDCGSGDQAVCVLRR